MDAAQMLTAREIARQCEELAQVARRPETTSGNRLRPLESVTEPIPAITAPDAVACEPAVQDEPPRRADRELTELELGVLAFERQWWKHPGGKERAIRELFDLPGARYYQLLNELLDDPAAAREDPMLIKRLRKVRASRQRARQARRLGIEWDS